MVSMALQTVSSAASGGGAPPPPSPAPNGGRPVAPSQGSRGQWTIVPNILWLNWSIGAGNSSADIDVYLLGMKVDSLSGTLNLGAAPSVSLQDDLDIKLPVLNYEVITGNLVITLDKTGLWVSGDLKVHGHDLGNIKVYLIHF